MSTRNGPPLSLDKTRRQLDAAALSALRRHVGRTSRHVTQDAYNDVYMHGARVIWKWGTYVSLGTGQLVRAGMRWHRSGKTERGRTGSTWRLFHGIQT